MISLKNVSRTRTRTIVIIFMRSNKHGITRNRDTRTKQRLGSDERIKMQMDRSKERWLQAIEKDKLTWDNHVSDLKKWECAPAKAYGVSSIPRTFMIDKEGNIAAMNLRGEQVEEVVVQDQEVSVLDQHQYLDRQRHQQHIYMMIIRNCYVRNVIMIVHKH